LIESIKEISSVACLIGLDGSKVPPFKLMWTLPEYQEPEISSGIATLKNTDGIKLNFVKS